MLSHGYGSQSLGLRRVGNQVLFESLSQDSHDKKLKNGDPFLRGYESSLKIHKYLGVDYPFLWAIPVQHGFGIDFSILTHSLCTAECPKCPRYGVSTSGSIVGHLTPQICCIFPNQPPHPGQWEHAPRWRSETFFVDILSVVGFRLSHLN